jgi:hypothetical protein
VRALPLLLLLLPACHPDVVAPHDHDGPLYFEVELLDVQGGLDPDDRRPFSGDGDAFRVRVTAMGYDKRPMDWSGDVALHATPGKLVGTESLRLVDGEAEATLTLALAYDQARLWVSDEGTEDEPGSFASGASSTLWFTRPTVADVQRPTNADGDSSLVHNYVPIRGWTEEDPRDLVVTSVLNDGFYVTDFSDPPGSYRSLFVFTFSRPDGIAPGLRLEYVTGIVSEFIGFTELGFPDWKVAGEPFVLPPPLVLDPSIVCDDEEMEKYEAEVVRIEDIASDFQRGSDCADYREHGQWPVALDGTCGGNPARMTVVNLNTVPCYRFPECDENRPPLDDTDPGAAETHPPLSALTGVLRHTAPADPPWILDVRSCLDFQPGELPESCDCQSLLQRPLSGPRKAPQYYYRDVASCDGSPYPIAPLLRDAR